uniref:V-SNARE coiled-coil homology domain-containing protein n=1 Tax=Strongyloides stercoralis TaxID=6248 RepID=A0A0K0EED0_STRER
MDTNISRNEIFLGNRSTNLDKQRQQIDSLRQSLTDVKAIAKNNIYKITEREEKLETLSKRIDNLKETTQQFSNNASKLKKKPIPAMYYRIGIIAVVCVVILCGTLFTIKTT